VDSIRSTIAAGSGHPTSSMSAAEWNALNETGLCSSSSAHRRFQEWEAAGVFHRLWELGLHEYDELKGLEWEWQTLESIPVTRPEPTQEQPACGPLLQ